MFKIKVIFVIFLIYFPVVGSTIIIANPKLVAIDKYFHRCVCFEIAAQSPENIGQILNISGPQLNQNSDDSIAEYHLTTNLPTDRSKVSNFKISIQALNEKTWSPFIYGTQIGFYTEFMDSIVQVIEKESGRLVFNLDLDHCSYFIGQ